MRWDRLFEDLEDQLASEWEAERQVLESEAERLGLSRVTLRERLIALEGPGRTISLTVRDGDPVRGEIVGVGVDLVALRPRERPRSLLLVPIEAISGLGAEQEDLLRSARGAGPGDRPPVADRITLGFVLRDAARRRRGVRMLVGGGAELAGTIDRVGADHLDLAVHDPGEPRRADRVRAYRIVPFRAIAHVRLDDDPRAALL